jgi:hypothetical protein
MRPGQVLLVPGEFGRVKKIVGALDDALNVAVESKHGASQAADADADDALDAESRRENFLDRAQVRNASRATAS